MAICHQPCGYLFSSTINCGHRVNASSNRPVTSRCVGRLGANSQEFAEMAFFARCAHVVEATKNGETEYWVVTTHRDDALTVVGSQVDHDWNLVLTERR